MVSLTAQYDPLQPAFKMNTKIYVIRRDDDAITTANVNQ